MDPWVVRDVVDDDLPALLALWDRSGTSGQDPVFSMTEALAAVHSRDPSVLAVRDGEVIGCAIATVRGQRAWVLRLAFSPQWRRRGVGQRPAARPRAAPAVAGCAPCLQRAARRRDRLRRLHEQRVHSQA